MLKEEKLRIGNLVRVKDGFDREPIYSFSSFGIFLGWADPTQEQETFGKWEKFLEDLGRTVCEDYKVAKVFIEGKVQTFYSAFWEIEKVEKKILTSYLICGTNNCRQETREKLG